MERILAKADYEYYLEYVHKGLYQHARHTKLISKKLQAIERGDLKRLIICLPPRHGKSMTVSETFPSYFIGRNPERRVIMVSYGDRLARRFGRANRDKLEEFGEKIFEIKLRQDNFSVTDWGIANHRGGMISAGIGGPITGEGADLLVIDDPVKRQQEADSKTYRDMVWHEWQYTLYTRVQPGGAIIIILTRWHEDDLVGRLLNPEYGPVEDWDIISLPAEAEDNDLLGRKPGEALWPEFGFDEHELAAIKEAIGSRAWASLYQQRPSPEEGNIINRNWWRYYRNAPTDFDVIIQSWDMSFKGLDTSDYVVGQVWGKKGADKYLLDQVRGRLDFPATVAAVKSLSAKWPQAGAKIVEDKANGPAIIDHLKHEVPGLIAYTPQGSKESRVIAVAAEIEAGNVYIPEQAFWVGDFVEECTTFPNGQHDDQVDAMTQALIRLRTQQIAIW